MNTFKRFIINNKISGSKLAIDGYMYVRLFKRKSTQYWNCVKLRSGKCNARAVTEKSLIVVKGPKHLAHSHEPPFHIKKENYIRDL